MRLELTPQLKARLEKQGVSFGQKPRPLPQPAMSKGEALLELHLKTHGIELGVPEYRFSDKGKHRFDRAWPIIKFAVEVEGLTGGEGGRHQRIEGFKADLVKYERAMLEGWTVYRCSFEMIKAGTAAATIRVMIDTLTKRELEGVYMADVQMPKYQ